MTMADYGLLLWGESFPELVETAKLAEAAGFASVWSSESQRTAFVPLAAVASATSRIGVCAGIALAFTRSPLITALTALDLDELAGGRFTLGLGSGVQRLNEQWHGVRFGKPVPHLRETISLIKRISANAASGKPVDFEGEYYQIHVRGYRRPFRPARESVPIFIAGVGPHMVTLAGEVADGWIGHELNSPAYIRDLILPNLDRGLKRSGRTLDGFTVCPSVVCAISRDRAEARRMAAGTVAFYATVRTFASLFEFHGFGDVVAKVQEAFRVGDHQAMVAAIPDEMVDAYVAAGTVDDVRARVTAYHEVADLIKLSAPRHFVEPGVTSDQVRTIIDTFSR
jgi:probable F420-dependent oxidoreductase